MKPLSQENAAPRRRAHVLAATILPLALFALLALARQAAAAQTATESQDAAPKLTAAQEAAARPAVQRFMRSSQGFVENRGQWPDASIRFAMNGGGVSVGLTSASLQFRLVRRLADAATSSTTATKFGVPPLGGDSKNSAHGGRRAKDKLKLELQTRKTTMRAFTARLAGARAVLPTGDERTSATINFRRGGDRKLWREGVPTWRAVDYKGIYDGIDLRVETGDAAAGNGAAASSRPGSPNPALGLAGIKYQFTVAPGADWRKIRFQYDGIEGLALTSDGALLIKPGAGMPSLTDAAPVIYQEVGGQRKTVAGRFVLAGDRACGFQIDGAYDAAKPLIIDPTLAWSTYLGGSSDDLGNAIAVDGAGNVYVTGDTTSSGWTTGGFDTTYKSYDDAFVAKLSSTGALLWSTYLGALDDSGGRGIAVDGSGNAYVTGYTWYSEGGNAFVTKLSPAGLLLWSTYLGGSNEDGGCGIAVDGLGNIYVTGYTHCSGWTTGGFDTSLSGYLNAFVAKLSSAGALLWSTYLGGSDYDYGYGIAVDGLGNAYVTGRTFSSGWTTGGFDTSLSGTEDAFVAKLSSAGTLLWSTYLGGNSYDDGQGIAVDGSGNVYVTGETASSGWTTGGYDTNYKGDWDPFVAKLSSAGVLLWSTYLGGSGNDVGYGIAVDGSGNAYVTGSTDSSGWTTGGFDTSFNGSTAYSDAFVAKLSSAGALLWSTYLGGNGWDYGEGIAVDGSDNVYVTGDTNSSGWTTGGFDTTFNSSSSSYYDAFVAKISDASTVTIEPEADADLGVVQISSTGAAEASAEGKAPRAAATGSSVSQAYQLTNNGATAVTLTAGMVDEHGKATTQFSITGGQALTLAPGETKTTTVSFIPSGAGRHVGIVQFAANGVEFLDRRLLGAAYDKLYNASLTGSVVYRDAGTGSTRPMKGAKVMAGGQWTTVNPSTGKFTIDGLGRPAVAGVTWNYMVMVKADDYATTERALIFSASQQAYDLGQVKLTPLNVKALDAKDTPVILVRGWSLTGWKSWDDPDDPEHAYWATVREQLEAQGFSEIWECNQPETGLFNTQGKIIDPLASVATNGQNLKRYIIEKLKIYENAHGYCPAKINFVAHSMGGLIVRQFLATREVHDPQVVDAAGDTVSVPIGSVIMLGTPNAGSPVADWVKANYGKSNQSFPVFACQQEDLLILNSVLILLGKGTIYSAAMSDLTTNNMRHFNDTYSWNSNDVEDLYLLAGTGGSSSSTAFFSLWIVNLYVYRAFADIIAQANDSGDSRNDGMVPLLSVTAKGSGGPTGGAWSMTPLAEPTPDLDHTQIHQAASVSTWVAGILEGNPAPYAKAMAQARTKASAEATTSTLPLSLIEQTSATLAGHGVFSVANDTTATLTVAVRWEGDLTSLTLTAPGGRVITPATTAGDATVQFARYDATDGASGILRYEIQQAAPGEWLATVQDAVTTTGTVHCWLEASNQGSSLTLTPTTIERALKDRTVEIACRLTRTDDGQTTGVTGALLTATIDTPDSRTLTLNLYDDGKHGDGAAGDGLFGASWDGTTTAGLYLVSYRASGQTTGGAPFQRLAGGSFEISSNSGFIVGQCADEGVDEDGDGATDAIRVKFQVWVAQAGRYAVSADLSDATSQLFHAANPAMDLPAGTSMASLDFDMSSQPLSGTIGPFDLKNLQLEEVNQSGLAWLDASSVQYSTGVYSRQKNGVDWAIWSLMK
jgi:hypothetical protein